jgi:RHS repeat-associated protein
MLTRHRETLLCCYRYDPLDRLVNSTPFEQPTQRYYCKTRLATEIQGAVRRSILQHDDQLLAQQQRDGANVTSTLLATDQQRSVLNALDANQPNPLAYSPYGHRPTENGLLSLLGFNGERPDPVTGHYHLGSGYRQFNPVLMRFNSPDSWSPFGKGGLNAYAYCQGDPANNTDPSGHLNTLGLIHQFPRRVTTPAPRPPAPRTFTRSIAIVEAPAPVPGATVPQSSYDRVIPGMYHPVTPETRNRYHHAALDDYHGFRQPSMTSPQRDNGARTAFYAALGMSPDGTLLSTPVASSQIAPAASRVPAPAPLPAQRPDSPPPYSPRRSETPPPDHASTGYDSISDRSNDVRGNR